MLGGFTRSLSALVHFTLHTGAGVDSVVYNKYMSLYYIRYGRRIYGIATAVAS